MKELNILFLLNGGIKFGVYWLICGNFFCNYFGRLFCLRIMIVIVLCVLVGNCSFFIFENIVFNIVFGFLEDDILCFISILIEGKVIWCVS